MERGPWSTDALQGDGGPAGRIENGFGVAEVGRVAAARLAMEPEALLTDPREPLGRIFRRELIGEIGVLRVADFRRDAAQWGDGLDVGLWKYGLGRPSSSFSFTST